jgi:hypothetical protein
MASLSSAAEVLFARHSNDVFQFGQGHEEFLGAVSGFQVVRFST